ncbi:MAG: hypothetical protein V4651_02440, partial [Bacteroidota bacterium]
GFAYETSFNKTKAIYWKNGVMNVLSNGGNPESYTSGIFINNQDVYVTGRTENDIPNEIKVVYWKNGVLTPIASSPNYTNAEAHSIFI